MSDAAHVGSFGHEVFNKPFKVKVKVEEWDTPDNYKRRRLVNEPEVGDKVKVWRVQNSGKSYGSVVARKHGFTDSPDAEIIAAGFNDGKEYGAVGIGRHGNILQWGFSMAPSKMTEPGRRLFVNCIVYAAKFDGKKPLVHRESRHRDNALRLGAMITEIKDKSFFEGTFLKDLMNKYKDDPDGLAKYYNDNYELIYRDKTFIIDSELRLLGIASNRKIETLETLIEYLSDKDKKATAGKLLGRYTEEKFQTQEQWKKWLDANRGRIYFSDVGGYKFRVVPQGYLD
jgi:hypothetical protein